MHPVTPCGPVGAPAVAGSAGVPSRGLTVSVVIPARNEEAYIGAAIEAVHRVLAHDGWGVEIVVVDDGSTDGTAEEVQRWGANRNTRLVRLSGMHGKGGALARGFVETSGDLVAFVDADLEYPPEALAVMASGIMERDAGSTCAVGVRIRDGRPWSERWSSRLASGMSRRLLGLPVRDTQAGVKMFPGRFAREVLSAAVQKGWLFDLEALVRAFDCALSVVEVPVTQVAVRPRRATLRAMARCAGPFLGMVLSRRFRLASIRPNQKRPVSFAVPQRER